jgi:antitoxin component YwqK of YwqJK toxin-antitoxin module
MKLSLITLLLFCAIACKETTKKPVDANVPKKENLFDTLRGEYKEWYPGRKQMKIDGSYTEQKRRQGLWTFYTEDGLELSTIHYENGLREGFSIVKRPDGSLFYTGEYKNDKPAGLWKFYDEKGVEVSTKQY